MGSSLFNTTPQNTYPGLLKLGDNLPLNGTLKAISDGAGNDTMLEISNTALQIGGSTGLFWDNTNKRLGVGTNAPTQKLTILGNNRILFTGVSAQNQTASFGTDSGDNAFINYGGGSGKSFSINGSGFDMWSSNANQVLIAGGSNGYLGIGVTGFSPNKVTIRGSGSTSATTSLLVQNSAGTELFRVRDDGNFNLAQGGLYWNTIGFGSYITSDGYTMFYNTRQDTKEHRFTIGGTEVFRVNRMSATDTRVVINNTSNGYASAVLSADSTTQGFLPPRMTNAQRAAIAAPAVGLMVYCTDAVEGLYVYKSTGWTFVI